MLSRKFLRHRRVFIAVSLAAIPGLLAAQTMAPPPRPATCVPGLHIYQAASELPEKFDTLHVQIQGAFTDMAMFDSLMHVEAAKAGATGMLIDQRPDPSGKERIRFLPVFVLSDTARIYQACRASGPAKPR